MPDVGRDLGRMLVLTLALLASACGSEVEPALPLGPESAVADRTDVDAPGEDRIGRQRSQGSVADRVRDAQLEARVLIALSDESRLSGYPFIAEVVAGDVVLSGNVATQADRQHAIRTAQSVDGVIRVVDGMTTDEPAAVSGASPSSGSTNGDTPAIAQEAPSAVYHTVRSGESLWTISRRHGVSIDDIRRLNNVQGNNVRAGQRLRVR